jgi:hypothetical protein
MRLQDARLCADCDEVHDAQQCPHCASERFSYLSRWVPIPKERERPRPTTSPVAEVYKQLIDPAPQLPTQSGVRRLIKQGAVGLTAIGVVGWLWRSSERARHDQSKQNDPNDRP